MQFINEAHRDAMLLFEEQADGEKMTAAQQAFLYVLAYYQEDYLAYEGEMFYIEGFDGIELGGPTYLLEPDVCLREGYPHEVAILLAKSFFEENAFIYKGEDRTLQALYQEACRIANHSLTRND